MRTPSGSGRHGLCGLTGTGNEIRVNRNRSYVDMRIAWVHGGNRSGWPTHLHRQPIEHCTAAAFEDETVGIHATKEDAIFWRVKGKEIRPPHQIGSLLVLHFKNFAIGPEKSGRRGIACQANAK